MFRKYDVIQCPNIEKFEKDKHYKCHMSKVFTGQKCAIDAKQPELSPRHRMIAIKAEKRRKDYMKKSRSNISPHFNVKGFPYSTQSSLYGSTKVTPSSPSSSRTYSTGITERPLFRSPAPYVEPSQIEMFQDFVPFQPTQTRQEKTLKLSRTLKTTKMETLNNEEESNSDILDDDLSSVSSGSEFLLS